jgi:hypothetical protein
MKKMIEAEAARQLLAADFQFKSIQLCRSEDRYDDHRSGPL